MKLSKVEILNLIKDWLIAWDEYNLEGVMELLHDDIVFENWTGITTIGKSNLQRSWVPWFINHGNFKFIEEDIFVDEQEQKVLFSWRLEWPSLEKNYKGQPEVRRGVDVLHFKDGKICNKYSYSKTTIQIDTLSIILSAPINK
jgi:ketosteroid isomerase-like protein